MKNIIHVWKPTVPQTKCGMSFKTMPPLQKPNIVNEQIAATLKPPVLCGNCYATQPRKDRCK